MGAEHKENQLTPQDVKAILEKNKDGKIYEKIDNYYTILKNDETFATLRRNVMMSNPEINGREWTDVEDSRLRLHMEKNYNLCGGKRLNDAFNLLTDERKYSPVQEMIQAIKWDGQERCEEFFIKWAKADDDKYSRECARLFFAQGIARAFNPGCKADYVITLYGKQEAGKSTLAEWLAMRREYYSRLKSIRGPEAEKNIEGSWIIELEELQAITDKNASDEDVKQFISSSVDKYRDSYGRRSINHPRTSIFIGTTNKANFLTDPTGNRRWYPLTMKQTGPYLYSHQDECREDIRQCWAEMYQYWKDGSQKAETFPDRKLIKVIEKKQQEAEIDDPDVGIIIEWLQKTKPEYICLRQVWDQALLRGRLPFRQSERVEMASKLVNKIGCKRGKQKRFDRYGQQRSFIVPKKLR